MTSWSIVRTALYSRTDPVHESHNDIFCVVSSFVLHLLIRPEFWRWPIVVNNTFV